MLYIGEQVGPDAAPTATTCRGSTSRSIRSRARTSSPTARPARSRCSPRPRRAASSTRRTPTSRSCASGRSRPARSTSATARPRTCGRSPRPSAAGSATSPWSSSSGRATTTSSPRSAQAGARIKLIGDGDLSAAISCAVSGTGVHAVMGTGGAPEGVITAAALRCLGGEIQARFRYRSDEERERGERMGHGDEDRGLPDRGPGPRREPRLRRDRGHRRRPAAGRPLLRRRRPDALAGDGLPGQAGPFRRHRPHVRPRPPALGPALGRGPETRLQGVRRAVPAPPPPGPRDRRGTGRLRLGLDQRPLPALAAHRRPRPQRPGLAGCGRPGDRAGDPRHERAHPVVPVQPGGRRAGVRHARLPGAGPGHPRRRDGRVLERDPGRHRLARPERAVRAPEGSRDADPGALPQGVPHVRRRVLPDQERDDLRPAGGAGPDLHRGLRTGRRATRRPDRRRDDLHLRQGRGPVHGHAAAGGRRGLPAGRSATRAAWTG